MTATAETSRPGAPGAVGDAEHDDHAPPVPSSRRRSFAVWLGGAAALGLVIRLMNVFWWRPTTDQPGYHGYRNWGDTFYYHHQANALADGKFFINPIKYVFDGVEVASAGHPPLYTLYLSLWSLVGIDSVTAHRVVSGLLGVATIIVVGLVGRRIAGAAVGIIAATIIAVYPFMWINDGMVMSESIVVLVAALVLWTAYSFVGEPTMRHAVLFGLACGAGALTRTEMALLFPLLLVPLALLARSLARRDRIKLAVVGCVVGAALIAPWVAFNLARFDKPVFLSTGIGNTLAYGSCDQTFYGTYIGYYAVCFTGPYPPGDESVRDTGPRKYTLDYIENHKSRLPIVVADARRAALGSVQAGPDHRARLVVRGTRSRPVVDLALLLLRDDPVRGVGARTDVAPEAHDPPHHRPDGDRDVRRRDHVRDHTLPRTRGSRHRARGRDRHRGRVDVAPITTRAGRGRALTTEATLERPAEEQPAAPPTLHTIDALRRPEGRPFVRGLVLITLAGAAVRLMNVLWWRPTTDRPGFHGFTLTGDAFYYHWQANTLAHGAWFVDPYRWKYLGVNVASAAHPPLYTLYLALWSRLGIDSVTGHRLASSLLGVAAVAVIGLLGYRLGGTAAGLVAAGIAALYPQLWINDGVLLSESIVVFVIVCALHTMYTFWRRPTLRNAIVLGLVCGLAALDRNELILLFPVVAIPLALPPRDLEWRPRIRLAVVACVAGAVLVAPWVVFNLTRFNEPTFMSTGLGSALSAANCDSVYYGSAIGYYDNCFQGPWPTGDESDRDLAPRHQAIQYMKDHITRLPVVVLARVARMWGLFRPGQTTLFDWSIEGRGRAPSWIGLFAFYLLMPFSVGGFVRLWRRRITILPLLAAPVILTVAAATTFGVTRYRAPAEVSIVITAAVGVVATAEWLRGRKPEAQSAGPAPSPGTLANP